MQYQHLSTGAVLLACLLAGASVRDQDKKPRISGRVLEESGKPLAGARVSIATARVRKGTSPY